MVEFLRWFVGFVFEHVVRDAGLDRAQVGGAHDEVFLRLAWVRRLVGRARKLVAKRGFVGENTAWNREMMISSNYSR